MVTYQNLVYIGLIFKRVFYEYFWQKIGASFLINFVLLAFDPALAIKVEALLILVIFDFIIAIYTNHKLGHQITSTKAVRSAIKLAIYCMMISSAILTEKAIGTHLLVPETVIALLAVTNFISILEHTAALGYPTPKVLLRYLVDFKNKQ